ncbi:hypothetical protein BgiMline_030765, partial [Biomphalaria glabrata]
MQPSPRAMLVKNGKAEGTRATKFILLLSHAQFVHYLRRPLDIVVSLSPLAKCFNDDAKMRASEYYIHK